MSNITGAYSAQLAIPPATVLHATPRDQQSHANLSATTDGEASKASPFQRISVDSGVDEDLTASVEGSQLVGNDKKSGALLSINVNSAAAKIGECNATANGLCPAVKVSSVDVASSSMPLDVSDGGRKTGQSTGTMSANPNREAGTVSEVRGRVERTEEEKEPRDTGGQEKADSIPEGPAASASSFSCSESEAEAPVSGVDRSFFGL
ncbi:hypothetical protein cyc_06935 [Cyclospora cayetanensis]|uniref:Uncharacterized protein n=1 Tax=Cyclospora cayetanensis TaxID=88456 RepID=A0A1D3CUY3_9EIME|nr:hypothetical protein cyc_06935 [Cyclospora cayetanensis]